MEGKIKFKRKVENKWKSKSETERRQGHGGERGTGEEQEMMRKVRPELGEDSDRRRGNKEAKREGGGVEEKIQEGGRRGRADKQVRKR